MTLIVGRLPILALHLLVASGMIGQTIGPVRTVGRLEPHQAIERELGTGQTDEYAVAVTAGEFVRVVAQQMGVAVVVRVLDPLGMTVLVAHRPNGAFGPEAVSFIGGTTGEYRIRVSSVSSSVGRYRMEFAELRDPTELDRRRIEAERTESQADRDRQGNTREAKLRAIESYERAASIWRSMQDAYEEGLGLYAIGTVYSALGEKRKALDYYG
jgi:hypothetical protein